MAQKAKEQLLLSSWKAFDTYYTGIYGSRWRDLRTALLGATTHCAMMNKFVSAPELKDISAYLMELGCVLLPGLPHPVYVFPALSEQARQALFPQPKACFSSGLLPYYLLDPASLLPVLALNVQPHHRVLDTCSAPGGKAVAISQYLASKGTLTVNDDSSSRRLRLKKVMADYIPDTAISRLSVMGLDASMWHKHENSLYDRVLVDAPCSSERHVMHSPEEMMTWSEKRPRTMAARQLKILLSAVRAVKSGGLVVYATCSLSPAENDGVIEKALKKSKVPLKVHKIRARSASAESDAKDGLAVPAMPFGEPTRHGWHILPDNNEHGLGPIYFAVLERSVDDEAQDGSGSEEDEEPEASTRNVSERNGYE